MAAKTDTTNPSRRAALGALASVPALAILPAAGSALALASTASPLHPDAALFAMQSAIDAADRELEAALDTLEAADDAYSAKEPERPEAPEAEFSAEERQAIDALRAAAARTPSPAFAAYEQAFADYERETERLKAECGVTAANELELAALAATGRAAQALVDTPARTLAGLIFKARYAAKRDYDEDLMASIVDDLLAEGFAEA
jgi:hypothetical protein